MITENLALKLMREGRLLMRMHTTTGMQWFVVPGGQIADIVTARILRRPDVQPNRDGLFRGCSQTFRLRQNWRNTK
jgi:hypothetical protein